MFNNVSQELREQIVNIIDDLVDKIVPGYLLPNPIFPFDYRTAIYEAAYKSLSAEFGMRRFENANYRDEVFESLREVPSEKFFNVTEHPLKEVCRIVHIQIAISDDIIPNPSAGNELWSRKASVRNRHIRLFKEAVDILNRSLDQGNAKYRYELSGESIQMVGLDTELDVPKQESGDIQEPDDSQTPEHHRDQSHSEFWNKKNYIITRVGLIVAVVVLIFTALIFFFGDGILRPLLPRVWN